MNKFAQSNFGRRPRCSAVAHICRKIHIGYNGAPQICPQKYPSPWTDPQACLIPGPVRPMMPNGIGIRSTVFPQCTGQTNRPTDGSRESLMTIGCCATRATWPNNEIVHNQMIQNTEGDADRRILLSIPVLQPGLQTLSPATSTVNNALQRLAEPLTRGTSVRLGAHMSF